jgi:RNA 2',3'-cyclic 3'-phosphodiesterase
VAGDDRILLFCALQLPDERLDELVDWQTRELRGAEGRLVPRANLHVTLAFLGARPAGEVAAVARELRAAAACAPAELELRPARYRETRNVGMIVLDDVTGAATEFAEDVQARLARLGAYRREPRAWLPHVTVLRFRRPGGARPQVANRCSIHVVRSALYRSHLGRDGARYDIVETAALGGSTSG